MQIISGFHKFLWSGVIYNGAFDSDTAYSGLAMSGIKTVILQSSSRRPPNVENTQLHLLSYSLLLIPDNCFIAYCFERELSYFPECAVIILIEYSSSIGDS